MFQQTPNMIVCDYCDNCDYYFGGQRFIWRNAKENGWLKYKGKHFDTKECLENFKNNIPYEENVHSFYKNR